MQSKTYHYSGAFCGAGKTEYAARKIGQTPALYLYVVDRVEEYDARRDRIRHYADEVCSDPVIRTLSSKAGDKVTRDFPLMIEQLSQKDHAVLMITHEAMKLVDHTVVEGLGWSIIIDEDPKIWSHSSFDIFASKPFWSATYNLNPFIEKYSVILPKADAPSWREINADDLTRPFAAFHNRLGRGQTIVNIGSWDELTERRQLSYFAVWDVTELKVYDHVLFLANCFDRLVTYRLIRALHPGIVLVEQPIGRQTEWLARDVTINYVAADHRAGTNFFSNTEEGKLAVRKWAEWASSIVEERSHYWSANKARNALTLPGERISPKIAGSNKYRRLNQCSVLYTAKANASENTVFAALSGGVIDPDTVMRDREYEDLVQIVFRSSLRVPEDTRPVTLNLYDREQAEFLASYFEDAGFPFRIRLNHVDLGLSFPDRDRAGKRTDPSKPPQSNADRQRAWRERRKGGAL